MSQRGRRATASGVPRASAVRMPGHRRARIAGNARPSCTEYGSARSLRAAERRRGALMSPRLAAASRTPSVVLASQGL
eukprot:4110189-Alexandrium_andersonii.AAC.1